MLLPNLVFGVIAACPAFTAALPIADAPRTEQAAPQKSVPDWLVPVGLTGLVGLGSTLGVGVWRDRVGYSKGFEHGKSVERTRNDEEKAWRCYSLWIALVQMNPEAYDFKDNADIAAQCRADPSRLSHLAEIEIRRIGDDHADQRQQQPNRPTNQPMEFSLDGVERDVIRKLSNMGGNLLQSFARTAGAVSRVHLPSLPPHPGFKPAVAPVFKAVRAL